MPSLKLRHLFIFLVFALLLGAWAGRTQISEFAITSSMQAYGLKNIATEISRLGLSQSHISRFEFLLETDTGYFQLKAYGLNLNYDLDQLAQGRVENLAINKLVLHHVNSGESSKKTQVIDEALEPLKIIAALRQALREYIIFNTFSVKNMALEGETFGIMQGKAFYLNGTNDAGNTYAEFTLLDQAESGQDKYLRQLQAMMIVADKDETYVLTGNGDVVEPDKLESGSGITAIGSGGNFALSAALAMDEYEKDADVLARKAMAIADRICVFTNGNLTVETLKA